MARHLFYELYVFFLACLITLIADFWGKKRWNTVHYICKPYKNWVITVRERKDFLINPFTQRRNKRFYARKHVNENGVADL